MTSPTPAELKRFYMALWMIESRAMASEPIPTELMDFLSRYGVPKVHDGKPVETFGEAWIAYGELCEGIDDELLTGDRSGILAETTYLTNDEIFSLNNVEQSPSFLLGREMREAWDQWISFTASRSESSWRAYGAAYLRTQMVVDSLNIDFALPKPVIRIQAISVRRGPTEEAA